MNMMLVKWWLLLAIPAIEGSLRLVKPKGFSVEERVMKKIQEKCYGDNDFKDLIFILGDFDEVFYKASVIRMNNLLNVDEEYESRQLMSSGVTRVVIMKDSPERLLLDLISFRKTRWWNHMLPFFIIGKNDEKCENFNEMLNTTWRMNITNSIYICSESENTTLYTLNPITDYAPDPWRRMEDLTDSNIYHQIFDPRTSCNNLNYDKTKVLNGYQIQTILSASSYDNADSLRWSNPSPLFSLKPLITAQLNASVTFKVFYPDELEYQLEEREADVIFYEWATVGDIRGSPLYFRKDTRCVALVKFNEITVLYTIRHLWSARVLCASVISLIILYSILRMKNVEVKSAILDIIRFLTYVPIRTDTRSNSFRIYFTAMLFFIVIINGVFQGKIAAYIMKSDKVPPIKTMKELNDLEYHFYVVPACEWVLSELDQSKLNITFMNGIPRPDYACINYVLNNTLNACIIPLWVYHHLYPSKPLNHIKPRVEISYPYSWTSRRDWPIHERFNSVLMQISESGIYAFHRDSFIHVMKHRDEADYHELALPEIESPYRPIGLANLDLAFELLKTGLSLAMFVLIVELRMREI